LFDFPHHLSSFNACEELDHLIILYPPASRTHEYWGDIVPSNYYGGAALDVMEHSSAAAVTVSNTVDTELIAYFAAGPVQDA